MYSFIARKKRRRSRSREAVLNCGAERDHKLTTDAAGDADTGTLGGGFGSLSNKALRWENNKALRWENYFVVNAPLRALSPELGVVG